MSVKKTLYSVEENILLSLLRQVRQDAGLTQADLAARLEVPQSFVSNYERGNRKLDMLQIRQICVAVGVRLAEFASMLDRAVSDAAKD